METPFAIVADPGVVPKVPVHHPKLTTETLELLEGGILE